MQNHLNNASFIKEIFTEQPYIFLMTGSNLIYTAFGVSVHAVFSVQKSLMTSIPLNTKANP